MYELALSTHIDTSSTMNTASNNSTPGSKMPAQIRAAHELVKAWKKESKKKIAKEKRNKKKKLLEVDKELSLGKKRLQAEIAKLEAKCILKKRRIEGISTPVVQEDISTPVVQEVISTPVVQEAVPIPVVQEDISTPVVQEVISTPVVQEAFPTPVVQEAVPAPVVQEAVPTPVVQEGVSTPVVQEGVWQWDEVTADFASEFPGWTKQIKIRANTSTNTFGSVDTRYISPLGEYDRRKVCRSLKKVRAFVHRQLVAAHPSPKAMQTEVTRLNALLEPIIS